MHAAAVRSRYAIYYDVETSRRAPFAGNTALILPLTSSPVVAAIVVVVVVVVVVAAAVVVVGTGLP